MACEKDFIKEDQPTTNEQADTSGINEDDDDYIWDNAKAIQIRLNENSIAVDSGSVLVSGSIATIISAGTYLITGSLTNGQLIVNTTDEGDVKLILNNVNITCATSAPLYISSAGKVIIILADGSENYVTDGTTYQNVVDNEPNAAIFSKADLTIFGKGSLTVDGNYNDGISSKDGLIIKSGTLTVSAADDGIRGKDYIFIYDAGITINSGGDGLKSDNENSTSSGFITVETGSYNITSGGDAIAAETTIEVNGGEFDLTSGGGSSKATYQSASAKGIKGIVSVLINDGTFTINSADDGLHSNAKVEINGGTIDISSGDDGIHADAGITIANGNINITKSYEGIESAGITIDNSTLRIVASDDGFNSTKGSAVESNDNSCLTINSGYVYVNSSGGDALDSNGNIVINGGTIVAHGPLSQPEVGLDYNGTCKLSGGTLVISGPGSNMTQSVSTSSTQYSVLVKFSSTLSANSLVHIQDSDGNDVLTFAPVHTYQSIIFSSSNLKSGRTYTIYTGGNSTGTVTDGLYTGGTYSGGSIYQSFTVSSIVTTIGSTGGPHGF